MGVLDDGQLDLFGGPAAPAPDRRAELEQLAARQPSHLRYGTSSWTFTGWAGHVYHRSYGSEKRFVRESLAEYARHPLLSTVGIDRSYYRPLSTADLTQYAAQLPRDFLAVSKVWSELTTQVFADHPRNGPRAGMANAGFLDVEVFEREVKAPFDAAFAGHCGPFLFECPPSPFGRDPRDFEAAVEGFLSRASPGRYAFELRDRSLLTPRYLEVLRAHGAGHVLNFWSAMPTVGEQLALPGVLTAQDFVVLRLMIPPGRRYERQKARFEPFDRIVEPQPQMRADVVQAVRAAGDAGKQCFVIVNNKAEGCSPLTIEALARAVAAAGS